MRLAEAIAEGAVLTHALYQRQIVLYSQAAFITLSAYDHLNLLPLEVRYVWHARQTPVTVLYYIMKYTFIVNFGILGFYDFSPPLTLSKCRPIFCAVRYAFEICLWCGEAILGLRVRAIWGGDHRMTFALIIIFLTLATTSLVNISNFLNSVQFQHVSTPNFTGCFVASADDSAAKSAACMVIWAALMLILIAIPGFYEHRIGSNSRFVKRVFRDGLSYYILLLTFHLLNLLMLHLGPLSLRYVFGGPARFLHVALTSRIFLNTRQQAGRQVIITHGFIEEEA